jgi:hypothetical protein
MALGILAVTVMLVMFIIFTVRTAADAESNSSMMFKTLAAYGQVVGVASLFPYRWPPIIVTLFNFLETITSVSDRILNTDCAMEAPGRAVPLTYEKAILYMVGPICFVAGATAFWGVVHLVMRVMWHRRSGRANRRRKLDSKNVDTGSSTETWHGKHNAGDDEEQDGIEMVTTKKRMSKRLSELQNERVSATTRPSKKLKDEWRWVHTKRYIIVSTIVVMVILHPTLTRQSLFLFMCTDIEGQPYLRKDVQLPCYNPEHLYYCIFVGVPGIIGYVIGTPVLTYFVLYRRRHKLQIAGPEGQAARGTYGFLYRGYRLFYWEIVIMTRKVSMVIVAVFGLRATVQTQALMALLVVVLAGAAHITNNPFQVAILHRLELFGLITAFVTLYFGMFFFTKDVEESPAFLFVVTAVILMTNLVYMMYWSVSLWRALREEVPVLMRCHTRCALECIQCRESLSDACSRVCCLCIRVARRTGLVHGAERGDAIDPNKNNTRRRPAHVVVWSSMQAGEEKTDAGDSSRRSWLSNPMTSSRTVLYKRSKSGSSRVIYRRKKSKRALKLVDMQQDDPTAFARRMRLMDKRHLEAGAQRKKNLQRAKMVRQKLIEMSSERDLRGEEEKKKKEKVMKKSFHTAAKALALAQKWKKRVRRRIAESPRDADEERCLDDATGEYYLINTKTGQVRWENDESDFESAEMTDNPLDRTDADEERCLDDATGNYYLINRKTGQTRWENETSTPGDDDMWDELEDDVGNCYFKNRKTGEVVWDLPEDAILASDRNDEAAEYTEGKLRITVDDEN